MIHDDSFLWVERYRPRRIVDCVLPSELKATLLSFYNQKHIPNVIFHGRAGCGKTTAARALCEQSDADYIFIRGSDERGIDTLRTKVKGFASTMSLTGGRKVVIIDEADNLSHDAQLALRGVIEEFIDNCSFIFTCNYVNRLLPEIHSRCTVISFQLKNDQKADIAKQFYERVCDILAKEKVEFDKEAVIALIKKFFPDFRRILNELQKYAPYGKITNDIVTGASTDVELSVLFQHLKAKNYAATRKWVGQHSDSESVTLMRAIYDNVTIHLDQESLIPATIYLAEYQYKSAFVADQEINLMAFLSHLMHECKFK